MIITELEDGGSEDARGGGEIVKANAKRVLVGAGARILFYPTLLYNVIRNKIQAEFRWWDEVDQFVLLGAVPFPRDVPLLRKIGVRGVITLNEPYETLVPSSLYEVYEIEHLVIPTRDYLFAPSLVDISRAVDFIHRNASRERKTYVHCKAGRGRSTTIVLCYLVEYKNMTPTDALEYVRSRRPRVLLAPSQWQAVQEYSRRKLEYPAIQSQMSKISPPRDEVLITGADLEGYGTADDDDAKFQIISSSEIAEERPVVVNHTTINPKEWDLVFVTEEDMEGYESCETSSPDTTISSDRTAMTNSLARRLSCLFSSVKFSSGRQPVASSMHEVRA